MKIIFNPSFLVRRMTHVLGEATSICRHGRRCHFSGGGGGVNFISPLSPSSILPPTPLKTPPSPTPIQRGRGNEVFLPFLPSPPPPSRSLPQQVCIAKRGGRGALGSRDRGGRTGKGATGTFPHLRSLRVYEYIEETSGRRRGKGVCVGSAGYYTQTTLDGL